MNAYTAAHDDRGGGVYVRKALIDLLGPARAIVFQQIVWLIEEAQYVIPEHERTVDEDGLTWARVPQKVLARYTGMSERTIRRHLAALVEEGVVLVDTSFGKVLDKANWLCVDHEDNLASSMRTEWPDRAEVAASNRPEWPDVDEDKLSSCSSLQDLETTDYETAAPTLSVVPAATEREGWAAKDPDVPRHIRSARSMIRGALA